MRQYIARRLLWSVPTVFGAATLIFILMRIIPGDVASVMLGGESGHVDAAQAEALRQQFGLNAPLWEQYLQFVWGLVRLDLGTSLWTGNPVWADVWVRLPYTASLLVMAMVVSVAVAIPVGVWSALRQDTWVDYGLRTVVIAGIAIPNFWSGLLVLIVMMQLFRWSPPLEYAPVYKAPLVALQQLALPALVLGYRLASVCARMMRSSMLEVLHEDYIRTAWAKGLWARTVVYGHALRNAILPVISLFGVEILYLIAGTVIIENIFVIPGVGSLLLSAINHRDIILVQGVVSMITVCVVAVNLLVDLVYARVDPRVRFR